MVKLRLKRRGRTHYPFYDIIAIDSRVRRDGASIEKIGYYDPHTKPSTIKIDPDRAIHWLDVGAQPTEIVRNLFSYDGVLLRRYLRDKGKNQIEIEEAVKIHKEVATARYHRRKQLRKKREIEKANREEAEKAKEENKQA
jgi:small subunit ribosomal protein S16